MTGLSAALPLESFHYTMMLTMREKAGRPGEVVVSTAGDYQSPGRHSFIHTVLLGPDILTREAVLIDDAVWFRRAALDWRETTREDAEVSELLAAAFSSVRADFLGGPSFENVRESVRRLTPVEESVNGVPANHYTVSAAGRAFFETFLEPEELLQSFDDVTWDLWLAIDGGWPVMLLVTARVPDGIPSLDLEGVVEWELRIEVSQANDPALSVVAPDLDD